MEQSQLMSDEAKEHVAANTMDAMGNPEHVENHESSGNILDTKTDDLPVYAKERLGRQEKRHRREMQSLREQLAQVQANQSNPGQQANPMQMQQQMQQPYGNQPAMQPMQGQQQGQPMGQDDVIQRAVSMALSHRDMQEQKAKNAEHVQHVQKQYSNLQDRLDAGSNKYDDFDDVVRGNDVPFTPSMRDAALLLHNPEDVLYKLGKNRDELSRISKLHPLDQAKEMVKLSVALASGDGANKSQTPKTLSNVKNNPINTADVNENTPVSALRQQMKSWKK